MRSFSSLVFALVLGVIGFSAPVFAQSIPGKILIKLEKAPKTDAEAATHVRSLACAKEHALTLERRSLWGWVVVTVEEEAEASALACLRDDKGLLAVDTIIVQHALRVPNDELIGQLWGFAAIGADVAWDTTVGVATQRIGVVDSGINRDHVDLVEKDARGFDFISDADIAEDGDGRDAEYQDVAPGAHFHGSHVAGTIAASADDGIGVPGLNWNAKLVTGRALGAGGGSSLDVVEAAAWMAGFDVPGVPGIGEDRVGVINLSLGSSTACSALERDFYGAIIASGVVVVAAAGNVDNFTPTDAPASCPGVIAVAAAGPTFELASYSNFDDRIDVVAPGGDGVGDFDPAESILSVDGSDDFSYVAIDGTSMACPHVTGVVSLMQAANPELSPAQIRAILQQSPFTCADESCDNKSFLDAPAAIAEALAREGELDVQPAAPSDGSDSDDDDDEGGGPDGHVGDDENGGCGPRSTPSDDGALCFCDPGFIVNEAATACVADDDDEDEDEDEDEEVSGCTSTGTPTSLLALFAVFALVRRGSHGPSTP